MAVVDTSLADRSDTVTPRPTLFPTALTIVKALAVGRWLAWGWMAGILLFTDPERLRHPLVGWFAAGVTLALTIVATLLVRTNPRRLVSHGFVAAEVGLAYVLSIVDGWVFEPGHVFETTQSIATQWPLISMATAGVAYGPAVAALLGALVGPAELAGALLNEHSPWATGEVVSIAASSIFFAILGGVFGWHARLLRRVEGEIADRRARDEVGRVLHDTVLQTLALVERRAKDSDPELAAAARRADQDLRSFLFGTTGRQPVDLEGHIRTEVERVRSRSDVPVTVSVIDDGCRLTDRDQELLARAIGEAVANALEHARPTRVVVFAETDHRGHVFASIHDDGTGFDPSVSRTTHGIDESILARIDSIGGRVTIESTVGVGTDVCIWSSGRGEA